MQILRQWFKDQYDKVTDWYDGFILGHKIVSDNMKAHYMTGYNEGSGDYTLSNKQQEVRQLEMQIAGLKTAVEKVAQERLDKAVNEELSKLLTVVDPEMVVKLDKVKGIIYVGGEMIDDARLNNLRSEAEALAEFDLWKILQETPKELAHQAMFVSGENIDDMKKGRTMLYMLATQKNIVDLFRNKKVIP